MRSQLVVDGPRHGIVGITGVRSGQETLNLPADAIGRVLGQAFPQHQLDQAVHLDARAVGRPQRQQAVGEVEGGVDRGAHGRRRVDDQVVGLAA